MGRDLALEAWLRAALEGERDMTEKAMFGGRAWLVGGRLACGARTDGMLARVGPERSGWALAMPGVTPMMMRGRPLEGWVRAGPDAESATRRQLLDAALAFVHALPAKSSGTKRG